MSSEKAKARRKWVEKQVKKFTDDMKAQGIDISSKFDKDSESGEAQAERLRIEMERGGEVEAWARREQLLQDIKAIKKEREENKHGIEKTPIPAGTIPLKPEQLGRGDSYDSFPEMIQDLRRMEQSDDPVAQKYAKQVLDEMFRKIAKSIKDKELTSPINYKEKEGELSIIGRYKKRQRDKQKEKAGY